MEVEIFLALVVAIAVIIAFVVYRRSNKTVELLEKEISNFELQLREKEKALEKERASSEKERKILEELIILSNIGYTPSDKERKKMVQEIQEDLKFIQTKSERIYHTERAVMVAEYLNAEGKVLLSIFKSLIYSLSESDRSLYQELIDYFSNYGFSFCGKKLDPGKV